MFSFEILQAEMDREENEAWTRPRPCASNPRPIRAPVPVNDPDEWLDSLAEHS